MTSYPRLFIAGASRPTPRARSERTSSTHPSFVHLARPFGDSLSQRGARQSENDLEAVASRVPGR